MTWINYLLTFIIGLSFGSFLNVVIYRLPRELSLVLPRSSCPHCQKPLKLHHNIPLIGFILLKGKCAFCQQNISIRYPIVELFTALIGLFLLWRFGLTQQFIASYVFSLVLIPLIFIDLEHQLLPDILTQSLVWLGLLASLSSIFTDAHSAIIGAVVGYLCLWVIAKTYEAFTHREGMGHGDFKLLAALCAWTGWQHLLDIILISSIAGTVIAIVLLIAHKANMKTAIPFGPFLAVAGWVVLIWMPYFNTFNFL